MDPRSLRQLIDITRNERLFDVGTPYRWGDEMLARALSEGEREAAVRGHLLREDSGSRTLLPLVEGQASYLLHPSIFEVDAVRYEGGVRLEPKAADVLDRQDPEWRTRTSSKPCHYILEALPSERLRLTLTRIPTDFVEGLSLRLVAYRRPLYEMSADGDEPEIAPHYHEHLVEWACFRAFSIRNPNLYDPVKAADHLANFERVFGPAEDAAQMRALRERRADVITPREF